MNTTEEVEVRKTHINIEVDKNR